MNNVSQQIAFAVLRLAVGINFLGHGLVRFPKLSGFRNWMTQTFQDTIIPIKMVSVWASVLPFIEFGIGLLLILGLFTLRTSIAGALVMLVLLFGSCMIENWEWVSFQMIYVLFFYILISKEHQNKWALDDLLKKGNSS